MASKLKISKGDTVKVIAGAGKGHTGTVLEVDADRLKIKVEGHAIKTHFDKENGITTKEGFVDYSNVKAAEASTRKKTTKKKKTKAKTETKAKTKKKTATKKTTKKKTKSKAKKKATKKKAAAKKKTAKKAEKAKKKSSKKR